MKSNLRDLRTEKTEKLLSAIGGIDGDLIVEAAPQQRDAARGHKRPRLRLAAVLAAVLVLLALTVGAGASGGLFQLPDLFAPMFHQNEASGPQTGLDMELIERMGRPIGVSAVDKGVTVRVESMLRDRYTCKLLISIHKQGLEGNDLNFDFASASGSLANNSGLGWNIMDVVEGDDAMQCAMTIFNMEGFPDGPASLELGDLVINPHRLLLETKIPGRWVMEFDTSFEDTSIELQAGQEFELEGVPMVLDELTVSPLSVMAKYHLAPDAPTDKDTVQRSMEMPDISLRLRSGEKLHIASALTGPGGAWRDIPWDQDLEYTRSMGCYTVAEFDRLLELDEIEAVVIEGVEVTVE